MTLSPGPFKLTLTVHVISSVGWFGAVAAFLALSIAGLISPDPQTVRGAYLAMDITTWWVTVPLDIAAVLSGLVLSLGTEWGLFRHYWVMVKLLLTIPATLLFLLHAQSIDFIARAADARILAEGDLAQLRMQLIADAAAACLVLLVATALSIYKPRGRTSASI
ncbi:MAG: hypothetical protein M3R30_09735 [Candidatus Eremiobacteraeota bacterium]|nr:hypothetical protein [Candidatus Eremiobacteraeota bacterium]